LGSYTSDASFDGSVTYSTPLVTLAGLYISPAPVCVWLQANKCDLVSPPLACKGFLFSERQFHFSVGPALERVRPLFAFRKLCFTSRLMRSRKYIVNMKPRARKTSLLG